MNEKARALEAARIMEVRLAIDIKRPPADVWRAITDDIGRWWPASFFCGGGRGPKRMLLEAWPGGCMFEDWGSGDGLLWGTIVNVNADKRLELQGVSSPAFGGPGLWYGSFELEPIASGTRLTFVESTIGRISDDFGRERDKGWRFLLDGALRAHLEGREPPVWDEESG